MPVKTYVSFHDLALTLADGMWRRLKDVHAELLARTAVHRKGSKYLEN